MSYFCHDCGTVIEEDEDTLCGRCKAKTSITPEPNVDVVESQKVLTVKVGKIIYDHVHKSSDPYAPTLDFKCKQAAKKVIPIITAEVERRVSGYRKALERVGRLASETLAMPSDNDSGTLVAIATTVEESLAKGAEQ